MCCPGLSLSLMSDSLRPHGQQLTRLLCPWDSPGKNTGVGCHVLLQGIFLTQGLNLGLPHCKWILYHLSHQGSPRYWSGQPIPSPGDLPNPGIKLHSPALQADSLTHHNHPNWIIHITIHSWCCVLQGFEQMYSDIYTIIILLQSIFIALKIFCYLSIHLPTTTKSSNHCFFFFFFFTVYKVLPFPECHTVESHNTQPFTLASFIQ